MFEPRLADIDIQHDPSIGQVAAVGKRSVLDASFFEGRVRSESEYAPVRDAMRRSWLRRLACPEARGCPDRAALFFDRQGGRVVSTHKHIDLGHWLAHIEWQPRSGIDTPALHEGFAPLACALRAQWSLVTAPQRPRIAIFVWRRLHGMEDLLSRKRLAPIRALWARSSDGTRARPFVGESVTSCQQYRQLTFNVHHALLPAFVSARACRHAFARGVRVLGVTSHYVAEALEEVAIRHQPSPFWRPRRRAPTTATLPSRGLE